MLCACQPRARSLTIFAATSLTDAQEELADAFEAEHPGLQVRTNYASSSTLATQIGEGALADVFASANALQMSRIGEAGLLRGEARIFASNRVALIVPAANAARVQSLDDLAQPDLRLVLALPGTPIRAYTDYLLQAAAAERDERYLADTLANLKSEEANVRLVLTKVLLGEADAAFVYHSDITPDIADQILVITTPERYQSEIAYPIAVLSHSRQPSLAAAYVDFVLSRAGQAILERWGLAPVADRAG